MPCYDPQAAGAGVLEAPPITSNREAVIVLAGNPNAGKTSLFNALTGLRTRTANFPGTTVERSEGRFRIRGIPVNVIDLPGMYSLEAATLDEEVSRKMLMGEFPGLGRPDAVVVLVDASNLERGLFLFSQIQELGLQVVVAMNMMDVADRHGIRIDAEKLSEELGCPVIPMVASTGAGVEGLKDQLARLVHDTSMEEFAFVSPPTACSSCSGCPYQSRYTWTEDVTSRCVRAPRVTGEGRTEMIDNVLTHPTIGVAVFLAVMLGVFYLIFSAASIPMDLIDALFGKAGGVVERLLPAGNLQSLVAHGIIGGVGGILVFLPQICILFFFLSLLEDSGYLARAAFVMDRLMRRIGLPGTAFVPLLSAHACAIPAIMATRVIRDPRDRLVTILVAPLMTCSARIPVYAMVTALLFPDNPGKAALVFVGAYGLGLFAALAMAYLLKQTILPGESKPLVLELPSYRVPSVRASLFYTVDRAKVFVRQAGTIILLISVALWALATFPSSERSADAEAALAQVESLKATGDVAAAQELAIRTDHQVRQESLRHSFAGRLGRLIEPVVAPLGFDWQIGIGIISSFAAREVIVSTLSVVYGMGDQANELGLYDTLRHAQRHDGTPVFTTATSLSLLVFYVLAMQCLPTQAVTKRETGSWTWAVFQLAYMTLLAYGAAFVTYQITSALLG